VEQQRSSEREEKVVPVSWIPQSSNWLRVTLLSWFKAGHQ